MESTPRLSDTLVHIFRQHQNWLDRRHLKTLAWMTVGLIQGWQNQSHGLGPLCAQPSRVRAEYRAAVCPLDRE